VAQAEFLAVMMLVVIRRSFPVTIHFEIVCTKPASPFHQRTVGGRGLCLGAGREAARSQRTVHIILVLLQDALLGGGFCSINPISISDYPSFLLSFYMPMPRRGAALRYLIICCMFLFQTVRLQLF
jgi:hypothetical protein